MKTLLYIPFILLLVLAVNSSLAQAPVQGKVIKIVDGDTYDILLANNTTKRIRLEGIDAPERGMRFYKSAKNHLAGLCFGLRVTIKPTGKDRYGRTLARTYLPTGKEIGLLMIEAGYAWHFKKYSTDMQLANTEIIAQKRRAGLWVDKKPISPWDWRKVRKN